MNEEYSSFEKELDQSGKLAYTNVGVSMMPLIREGRDVMIIEKYVDPPKRFDVVLFRRNGVVGRGKYVVHRIVKVLKDGKYFIAGDNCTEGEYVERSDILGVMTAVVRDGKRVKKGSFRYDAYVRLWCAPYRSRFFLLRAKRGIAYFFSAIRYKLLGK